MYKNFYYTNEVSNKIKEVLDSELPIEIKNISIGNFKLLPAPEHIAEYIPAVFIDPLMVDSDSANETLEIEAEVYPFSILYMAPYSYEVPEEMGPKIKQAEVIANILRGNPDLKSFTIPISEGEAGGRVLYVKVVRIQFDNISTELFHQVKIPACVIEIQLQIIFRTFGS